MSKTTQLEYATAKVPTSVWVVKSRRTEGTEEDARSVLSEVASGRAFLEVVAYPWGVEFEVRSAEGGA